LQTERSLYFCGNPERRRIHPASDPINQNSYFNVFLYYFISFSNKFSLFLFENDLK
jgi:hypothetical protein